MHKTSICILAAATAMATPALANDSKDLSKASGDSAVASARLTVAGVKVVAGVALRPVRRLARDSQSAGQALQDSGHFIRDSTDKPLDVSPETVVAQPAPQVPYDTPVPDQK